MNDKEIRESLDELARRTTDADAKRDALFAKAATLPAPAANTEVPRHVHCLQCTAPVSIVGTQAALCSRECVDAFASKLSLGLSEKLNGSYPVCHTCGRYFYRWRSSRTVICSKACMRSRRP